MIHSRASQPQMFLDSAERALDHAESLFRCRGRVVLAIHVLVADTVWDTGQSDVWKVTSLLTATNFRKAYTTN